MTNLYPFLIYVIVTTFTPGPNNIMSMSNAMRFGYRRTLGFLTGIFTGFVLVMLACGLLNIVLASRLPQIQFWLNILGAIYLFYLAVHTILSRPAEDRPGDINLNTFTAGVAMQFVNVKVLLYGVTVFSMFITQSFQNPVTVSLFAPLLAAVGFLATSLWALGGSIFRRFWQKHYLAFNLAMGALLIYTGLHSLLVH